MRTLNVTEIYTSIQGESTYAGKPCTFIRLSGCPLRCRWCDTAYAFEQGPTLTIDDVLEKVDELGVRLVELTGGEPLAQANAIDLVKNLIDQGYQVLIETSGAIDISPVPPKAHIIMDLKCPGSQMSDKNLWSNIQHLKTSDEIKFVIAGHDDFQWACEVVKKYTLESICQLLISPAFGQVKLPDLAQWVIESKIDYRMQLQMHKYIWHPRAKGV